MKKVIVTRTRIISTVAVLIVISASIVAWIAKGSAGNPSEAINTTSIPIRATKGTLEVQIRLDNAKTASVPANSEFLTPVAFNTDDGKEGWVVNIPGSRPIATPAYADGMIFVGGGYGSHEFYALDADTGKIKWKIQTKDDGPTAAVVEDGYVAFNTESCTVYVAEAKTGKVVWEEWLGDPLMSQPAINKGKLYIAYPDSKRSSDHFLLCTDLKTGRHLWQSKISGDVITAPVISDNQVFITCFDGTSYSLDANTGKIIWKKENAGTSAPTVAEGHVIATVKETDKDGTYEVVKKFEKSLGSEVKTNLVTKDKAEYLKKGKGGGVAIDAEKAKNLDSSVGFSTAPSAAKLDQADKHIGVDTVSRAWAYQGSRAAYSKGRAMNAQGKFVNSINVKDGNQAWRAEITGKDVKDGMQVFSPPSLGKKHMYFASSLGHIVSVDQETGVTQFIYALKSPIVFQPALARGNIYIGTADGKIICLKTGGNDADGWYAWGGNAQHNKN